VNTFWFRSNVYHRAISLPIRNTHHTHVPGRKYIQNIMLYRLLRLLARSKCGFRIV